MYPVYPYILYTLCTLYIIVNVIRCTSTSQAPNLYIKYLFVYSFRLLLFLYTPSIFSTFFTSSTSSTSSTSTSQENLYIKYQSPVHLSPVNLSPPLSPPVWACTSSNGSERDHYHIGVSRNIIHRGKNVRM